jgi:hypothetical protein
MTALPLRDQYQRAIGILSGAEQEQLQAVYDFFNYVLPNYQNSSNRVLVVGIEKGGKNPTARMVESLKYVDVLQKGNAYDGPFIVYRVHEIPKHSRGTIENLPKSIDEVVDHQSDTRLIVLNPKPA